PPRPPLFPYTTLFRSKGAGLSGTGLLANSGTYTVLMTVEFDSMTVGGRYVKILDFKNGTSENGLYYDSARSLRFYNYASSLSPRSEEHTSELQSLRHL